MLTRDDRTVDDAEQVLSSVRNTGLTRVGFKDVGATPDRQRALAAAAHDSGLTVYLEIVSLTKDEELAAVDSAVEAGVDWVIGGTFASDVARRLAGSRTGFAPFAGHVSGHPSILSGRISEIADDAARLVAVDGVGGIDLLAYRHASADALELTREVAGAVGGAPVIAAGSVVNAQQITGLATAGAWGFTMGSGIFEAALPGSPDVVSQVQTALELARGAVAAEG